MHHAVNRRGFLRGAGIVGLGLAAPFIARGAASPLRIVSNPGLENATLTALIEEQGLFRRYGVDATIVEVPGITGPFDAIAAGTADVCMVSGYNMVLARIAQGARVKIVGAGMKKAALAVLAQPGGATRLTGLIGKSVAVGPPLGLLHTLMLQLLRDAGVEAARVRFVDKGSNDQCHDAVVKGEVDACCTSISHLGDADGLVALPDGKLWQALPRCTFQTAYASNDAIAGKQEQLTAVMAAYGALYAYLMTPEAHDAFFAARKRVQTRFDRASAQAVWDFNQAERPYARDLTLTGADIGYLQDMYLDAGSLQRKQPVAEVADMRAARAAAHLL